MFLAKERFEMVQKGVQHLKNVFLHKTSDYLISPATFPTYFIKDKARADDINCALDLEIFNTYIVQTLGINVRFVGQEPYCQVTNAYNQTMRAYFEQKNIEFCEIERKTVGDRAISATYVREKIFAGDFCAIKDFVPQTTLEYLKNR